MSEYTNEPWIVREGDQFQHDIIVTSYDRMCRSFVPICEIESDFRGSIGAEQKANARRIAACVNALAGWQTETVEKYCADGQPGRPNLGQAFAGLRAQRDELLEACKTFLEWVLREETGFCKAGRDRSTPEGEAAWREWYDENIRLCSLAQEQARAAIANATGEQQ